MGARTLFAAMPRAGEPVYDRDREMLDIIHDGGEGGGGSMRTGRWTTWIHLVWQLPAVAVLHPDGHATVLHPYR